MIYSMLSATGIIILITLFPPMPTWRLLTIVALLLMVTLANFMMGNERR